MNRHSEQTRGYEDIAYFKQLYLDDLKVHRRDCHLVNGIVLALFITIVVVQLITIIVNQNIAVELGCAEYITGYFTWK